MTQIAAFEEREYEHALYDEFKVSQRRAWAPGQVLEGNLGFDTTLFTAAPFPDPVHGFSPPPGVLLPRYWSFLRKHLLVPPTKILPNFLLNVFIQSKRPRYLKTASTAVAALGIKGAHWAFALDAEQQLVLEKLEAKFAGKVIVTYASPTFHTERALYQHILGGSIAAHSTFPPPSALSGHKHWHYKKPGASGVAQSEPVFVDGLPLGERIAALLGGEGGASGPRGDGVWLIYLQRLSVSIREVMEDDALPESFHRAQYVARIREISAATEHLRDDEPWLSPYLKIIAFLSIYRLAWLVLA